MQLSFVGFRDPGPPIDGAKLRNAEILRRLEGKVEVTLFEPGTNRANGSTEFTLPNPISWKLASILAFVKRTAPHEEIDIYHRGRRLVGSVIPQHGPIFVSQLHGMMLVPNCYWQRVVLDTQNIESQRIARIASQQSNVRSRAVRLFTDAVCHYEKAVFQSVRTVVCVSDGDASLAEELGARSVLVAGNGCDRRQLRKDVSRGSLELLYVGSFDYAANRQAAAYIVERLIPLLSTEWKATIVGSTKFLRTKKWLNTLRSERVQVYANAESLDKYYERSTLLVVPLEQGGGSRLKIAEALSFGLPVVSTTLGAEGYAGAPIRTVNSAGDLVDEIASIERLDAQSYRSWSQESAEYAERHLSWDRTLQPLITELCGQ